MAVKPLHMHRRPELTGGRMVLAFSGWMDGGDVSTGTVARLVSHLRARSMARIEPDGFYIYHFPGSMEIAALFRPKVRIEKGIIRQCDPPANEFFVHEPSNLILFVGKEPNLHWRTFGDCIFEVAERCGVEQILFVGSFGGAVPHTRLPRLYVSASDEPTLGRMTSLGLKPSDYEGPGSFTTYLMTQAPPHGVTMASIVAEIPGYLQGTNPLCIESVSRRLAALLNLELDLQELRGLSAKWEDRVTEVVASDEELTKQVRELEEQYDEELLRSQSDDSSAT